jgi:hypothetical protein
MVPIWAMSCSTDSRRAQRVSLTDWASRNEANTVHRGDAVAAWFPCLNLATHVLDVAVNGAVADIAHIGVRAVKQLHP